MKAGVRADRKSAGICAAISTSPGQKDEIGEVFRVSETGGAVLEDFENTVDAFADGVGKGGKRRTPMTENEHQARYRTKNGSLGSIQGMTVGPSCPSLTPCSPPSRTLRAACGGGLRPSLTASVLGVLREIGPG